MHLNPARARLLGPEEALEAYCWSSYPWYLKDAMSRPVWLRVDRLLGEWGIPKDSLAGREQFGLRLEARRQAEAQPDFDPYKQGWCLGGEAFRQELLAQVSEAASPAHRGLEIQESAADKAERILQEELTKLGWTAEHLQARSKGHGQKVRIAARLWRETLMTLAWVAERLHMGAPSHVAHLLYHCKKEDSCCEHSQNTLF